MAVDTGTTPASSWATASWLSGVSSPTEFNTYIASPLKWLYDNKANLAAPNFTGAVSITGTLGVSGASTLATLGLSGALNMAVEAVFTGLGTPPSAPSAGKAALYFDTSFLLKVRTPSTTYTAAYLELANTFAAAQTLSGAGSNLIINSPAGNNQDIMFQSGGTNAIIIRKTNDARSGSDVGDNWAVNTRTDAGSSKAFPIYVERSSGFLATNTTSPTAQFDINGNTLRLRSSRTPASASAAGNAGDICWDSTYIYIATGTNQWRRIAHAGGF